VDDIDGPATRRAVAVRHSDMMPQVNGVLSGRAGGNVAPG
jgi:hypothetical protein